MCGVQTYRAVHNRSYRPLQAPGRIPCTATEIGQND